MPGKTAWCPSIRASRSCDCNVLRPRDPGTVLAETANQIDVLTFLEMGESSYAPILVGSDAEICAVDVPVATYRMRVIPLFVKLLDGRRLIIPVGDAHCSGNNVRALRVLELPRKPCRADNRIRVGGGKPRRRGRSATVGAERRESGGTRFSDIVVLCSNDVDAARDHFTRSVGAAVQDRDNPNGNTRAENRFEVNFARSPPRPRSRDHDLSGSVRWIVGTRKTRDPGGTRRGRRRCRRSRRRTPGP